VSIRSVRLWVLKIDVSKKSTAYDPLRKNVIRLRAGEVHNREARVLSPFILLVEVSKTAGAQFGNCTYSKVTCLAHVGRRSCRLLPDDDGDAGLTGDSTDKYLYWLDTRLNVIRYSNVHLQQT
jgi:hypothetical protein